MALLGDMPCFSLCDLWSWAFSSLLSHNIGYITEMLRHSFSFPRAQDAIFFLLAFTNRALLSNSDMTESNEGRDSVTVLINVRNLTQTDSQSTHPKLMAPI